MEDGEAFVVVPIPANQEESAKPKSVPVYSPISSPKPFFPYLNLTPVRQLVPVLNRAFNSIIPPLFIPPGYLYDINNFNNEG